MTEIKLNRCTSEPLSSYLSACAVLRLVCEQKDPDALGWWNNGVFHLKSSLDRDGLITFFLQEYRPTPIVSPWGGGSGFYEGDNTEGLDAILKADSDRFSTYQDIIRTIRSFPEMPNVTYPVEQLLKNFKEAADNSRGKKRDDSLEQIFNIQNLVNQVSYHAPEENLLTLTIEELEEIAKLPKKATKSEKDRSTAIKKVVTEAKKVRNKIKSQKRSAGKGEIISACRDRLNDRAVEWIDAAIVIGPDGEPSYPPILGTGGNEGRLEYSNGFMKCIKWMLLDDPDISLSLLQNAIFDEPTEHLRCASVGMYDPGHAGGFNQGFGIETKDFPVNPWTYILTLEGAIPWASSIARRQRSTGGYDLRSPFTVKATPVGYNSSSDKDQFDARAEIWTPLWERPAGYREIRMLLSEGRADVGRTPATNGIEFAEAVTSLGVDRGISEFVRYNLLKRRGDNYVALPSGRFPVRFRTESDLIRELNPLLKRIDSVLRGDDVPASLVSARRTVDAALYSVLLHGGATHMKLLVAAIGRFEQLIMKNTLIKRTTNNSSKRNSTLNKPLTGLSPKWISSADDGSIEVRIAAALASIGPTGDVGPIRANLTPIHPKKPWQWDEGRGQVAWEGNSIFSRMRTVLARRMMDAARLGAESNPLWGAIKLTAEDICAIIEGDLDESLVEDLVFGFCWVRWGDKEAVRAVRRELWYGHGWNRPVIPRIVPRSFALLKILFLPGGVKIGDDAIVIKPEPSIIPLLQGGRIRDACTIAGRRLKTTGLNPITTSFPDGFNGPRMAAALLLPISGEQALMNYVLEKTKE